MTDDRDRHALTGAKAVHFTESGTWVPTAEPGPLRLQGLQASAGRKADSARHPRSRHYGEMEIREERQLNPVADDVSALIAVTRPIIVGLLHSIAEEHLVPHGGRANMRLADLGRVRKANDGDLGVAFEYAVHNAVINGEATVLERVDTALQRCNIRGPQASSILFAIEKTGAKQLLETNHDLITPESRVLSGKRGQPAKLQAHMNRLASAFHRPATRRQLPRSIQGLWKADLFLGSTTEDRWVGTSIKVNPGRLEGAPGLRIAIVPSETERSDSVRHDEQKNLIICPLPHDFSFMQTFYEGMRIVQTLLARDFRIPTAPELPTAAHREVARVYVERRDYKVQEVIDAVGAFAQPHLLDTKSETITATDFAGSRPSDTSTALGPIPQLDRK